MSFRVTGLLPITITVLFLSIPLLALGCASSPNETGEVTPEDLGTPEESLPASPVKDLPPVDEADDLVAVIETAKGVIKFRFYPNEAPNTVANFVKLARDGFYDGTKFHRVEPGFVIQGGDPNSKDSDPNNDGQGGPGYTIAAEFSELKHEKGAVAMARMADNIDSAGSQFYVTLEPQPGLDGQYTVFGQVTKGMDVVDKIEKGDVIDKIAVEPQS